MKFTDFNFKDYINQTLENIKFEKPTEVPVSYTHLDVYKRQIAG